MPNPQPKRPRGRPKGTTKPPEERKSERYELPLTPALREKLERLGGAPWLRKQIEEARL